LFDTIILGDDHPCCQSAHREAAARYTIYALRQTPVRCSIRSRQIRQQNQ
jgi:hypothetical protein